jgi:hypothetical protein
MLIVLIFVICNLLYIILKFDEVSVLDIMKSVGHHELSRHALILGSCVMREYLRCLMRKF